jgi:hypothetical protein
MRVCVFCDCKREDTLGQSFQRTLGEEIVSLTFSSVLFVHFKVREAPFKANLVTQHKTGAPIRAFASKY